ncbi:YbjN domain-containing protein [Corynebacterium variabile]|uniref:YbjN domain-containing protein n=1 Tax=Corynebacterium variabile TaxID=1727 RepID=UPI0026477BF3|nr:YbjN domain-containing protein [Corynebacterium variabile]MDN6476454.1 YbjN domain-containing protein [Corynebacterium variabile]MDN6675222.1 YbjN domain-containing protein [Corynebacterium variabile]MDN6843185.1 YbjN domain-containing protein [Corynebacterium variabile]
MFGRKSSKTRRQWKDAPDPGTESIAPARHPDAEAASSVVRRVFVEVGGEDVADFDVDVSATTGPLTVRLEAVWHGTVAPTAGLGAGSGVDTALNSWNAGHTVPRAYARLDDSDQIRVCADSVMTCGAGVTVQQLDEWMRRALAGLSALREYLGQRWPGAATDAVAAPVGQVADGDITALVVDGNPYGLLGGKTPAVLLPRIGVEVVGRTEVKESGVSGRRGNGYLRFADGPDVALHDGTLSVSSGIALGTPGSLDPDTVDWLHALCGRVNALPGSVVAVFDGANLTCAVHRPVGSGLSDAQLTDAVTRDRVVVRETVLMLLSEIREDSAGTDGVEDGSADA